MRYVLIGGTGTLGQELTRQLEWRDPKAKITIFSRDEAKQQAMRSRFSVARYVIGDVRDRDALRSVLSSCDVAFLLAAIKHIDVAEQNPLEAVKTNFLGAVNVAEVALQTGVKYVVYSNTDKAVLPITTYGYSKALAQNYLLSLNERNETKFSAFNWGNIAGSRGSVINTFVNSLKNHGKVRVTDARMTRFWLTIDQAAAFMLQNYKIASRDRAMVPPLKAATVVRVAETVAYLLGVTNYDIEMVGLRGTEKIHEVLDSSHGGCLRSDTCEQYTDEELRDLLRPIVLSADLRAAQGVA